MHHDLQDEKSFYYFKVSLFPCPQWRALTIVLIDMVAEEVRKHFKKTESEMSLPMVLEGGEIFVCR